MKFAALVALAVVAAHAETSAERGKRVIDESLAALGGEKFLGIQDRVEEGRAYSFYRSRMTGLSKARVSTRYVSSSNPDHIAQRERQVFGKDESYYLLFLEDKAFSVTFRGAAPLPDERWERYALSTRNNILYLFRNRLKEPGLIFESRGTEVWQNTPVEVVAITDANNQVITVYFHATTKVPVREAWTVRDPITRDRIDYSTLFTKYRDVGGGAMWPFNILTERNGDKVFEMFSETVLVNQGLAADLFTLGSRIPLLDPEK